MQRTSEGCCRPRHAFAGKLVVEQERKCCKQRIKREIPNQGEQGMSRIEILKMPGMLEHQHGHERNGGEKVE